MMVHDLIKLRVGIFNHYITNVIIYIGTYFIWSVAEYIFSDDFYGSMSIKESYSFAMSTCLTATQIRDT